MSVDSWFLIFFQKEKINGFEWKGDQIAPKNTQSFFIHVQSYQKTLFFEAKRSQCLIFVFLHFEFFLYFLIIKREI